VRHVIERLYRSLTSDPRRINIISAYKANTFNRGEYMAKRAKAKRGRPPMKPSEKSVMLTARIDRETKASLDKAVRAARRARPTWSLGKEVAWRLRRSFIKRQDVLGDDQCHGLALAVARLASVTQSTTRTGWRDHRYTAEVVRAGIAALLTHP